MILALATDPSAPVGALATLSGLPFWVRFLGLLLFLAAAAAVDRWRNGPEARRWREYAFLLAGGGLGAAFGAGVDQVSMTLSPEYFELGKGIPPGPGFRWGATMVGLQAGFVGGLFVAGVLLVANNPRPGRAALPGRALWALTPVILASALGLAVPGWVLGPVFLGHDYASELLGPERLVALLRVWGLHVGLYLGSILGLASAIVSLRRARRSESMRS